VTVEDVTPGPLGNKVYRLVFIDGEDDAAQEQFEVMLEALRIYERKNVQYKDNWKRMGWRGMLVRVRERAERLWDSLWSHPSGDDPTNDVAPRSSEGKLDDAIDLINFACFLVRAVRDGNRDGSWWDGI
jgi:hypothetical protein